MFRIWSHFTRRSHFAKMQQSFAAQSFLAKPLFCKAILQLRNITHDMTRVQLLDVQPGKAHRLEVLPPALLILSLAACSAWWGLHVRYLRALTVSA